MSSGYAIRSGPTGCDGQISEVRDYRYLGKVMKPMTTAAVVTPRGVVPIFAIQRQDRDWWGPGGQGNPKIERLKARAAEHHDSGPPPTQASG